MNFSTQELVDMIWILGECHKNCLLATRIYSERFPERRKPNKNAFIKAMNRFNRTASAAYEKKVRIKTVVNEENEFNALLSITENPHTSTRIISREQEIGRTSVRRIISKNKLHPFHIQLHQELINDDFLQRVTFCQWAQRKINNEQTFFEFVMFGDEATFHRNGALNRHNFHYYSTTNPHYIVTHSQTRWSLNVWGGVLGEYVIGPYFFERRVTGEVYLDFLENRLPELLENVPLNIRQRMWYLHDGAPVHHTQPISNYLNTNFPERWIGRGGPVRWPARSPDLTKMDFFLWGYVKNIVYATPPTTRDDMKRRIRNVFQDITVEMLRNVSREFKERLQCCMDVEGGHFECFL